MFTCLLLREININALILLFLNSSLHYLEKFKWLRTCMIIQFSSVQSLSPVRLFANPWITARQAFLSIINSRSSLKLKSIESVMQSSHLILCHPFLLLLPIPPSIRVFSIESILHMRWPKYWSCSFSIFPSKEQSSPTPQFKSINTSVLSFLHSPTLTSIHDHWKKP